MTDASGKMLADNVYWESARGDDVGPANNDKQFEVKWTQLSEMSALNTIPAARVAVSGTYEQMNGETHAHIRLTNNSNHVAFFLRVEIMQDSNGMEILPIRYDDNYVTVFPHESRTLEAVFDSALLAGHNPGVRLEGYDLPKQIAPLTAEKTQ